MFAPADASFVHPRAFADKLKLPCVCLYVYVSGAKTGIKMCLPARLDLKAKWPTNTGVS